MLHVLNNVLVTTTIWRNYLAIPTKNRHAHTLYPSTSTPGHRSNRNEYIDYLKDMHKNIHRSTIYNRPKLKTSKCQ